MMDTTARDGLLALQARLRPFIARRVRSDSDIDDVMQEVLLRMQRSLRDLKDDQRMDSWVYAITRNAIHDHHRSAARHPLASPTAQEASEVPPIEDEVDSDGHDAAVGCLSPFVAQLPAPYREAITLSELEGVTQRKAAEMLGIGLSAMKSRVQRGRAQLRAALEACCAIGVDARGHVTSCETRGTREAGCGCAPQNPSKRAISSTDARSERS